MQKNEIWTEYKVNSNDYQRFIFNINEKQRGFKIAISAKIDEVDKNIVFHLATYEDSEKLRAWMRQRWTYKKDSNGQIVKDKDGYSIQIPIPRPQINDIVYIKSNMLEKTLLLPAGSYTLMFDNTYSAFTAKNVWLHVIETWDGNMPTSDMPIVEHLAKDLPDEVSTCIVDANNSYTSGHFNQCSVMLRKAIEVAIKIKLQQAGINIDEVFDKTGNDLTLAGKIKLLRKHKLITARTSSDLDQIKWFGDVGAHGTMRVNVSDVKDNIEPKIRSFLVGLNLKI